MRHVKSRARLLAEKRAPLISYTLFYTPTNHTKMDPQRIIELQKHYQNTNKELWLKGPRSKMLVYPFYAMFAFSTAASLYYTGRAIAGLKDE